MKLHSISDNWVVRKYPDKQILIYSGDETSRLFYIQKGFVKVYNITDEGEERILLILKPQDIFPLLRDPEKSIQRSLYFYSAMSDVELMINDQEKVISGLRKNRQESWELLRYISDFSSVLSERLAQLESKKAGNKLTRLFGYLISVCGSETKLNAYILRLKLTHQDIASMVGLTRETVSKELKKLERKNLITYRNGFLILDSSFAKPVD